MQWRRASSSRGCRRVHFTSGSPSARHTPCPETFAWHTLHPAPTFCSAHACPHPPCTFCLSHAPTLYLLLITCPHPVPSAYYHMPPPCTFCLSHAPTLYLQLNITCPYPAPSACRSRSLRRSGAATRHLAQRPRAWLA